MADEGKLCYKRGGDALCYKHGGDGALVYKSRPVGETVVDVELAPVDWHCLTYDQDHTAVVSCSGRFTQGGGSVETSSSGTKWTFTIRRTDRTETKFQISFQVVSTRCIGDEDPGVHASVVATQTSEGEGFSADAGVPVGSDGTITVSFGADGRLKRVE